MRSEIVQIMPNNYKVTQNINRSTNSAKPVPANTLESLALILNCLLISPVSPSDTYYPLKARHLDYLENLCRAVWERPQGEWTIASASSYLQYSPFHFSRIFKAELGIGFPEFVLSCRVRKVILESMHEGTALKHRFMDFGFRTQSHFR
ncbi:MAG: AraC family transcriptional regulator, partial [Fimbriimonadaceae bacterium]